MANQHLPSQINIYHGKSTFTMANQHLRDPLIISSLDVSPHLFASLLHVKLDNLRLASKQTRQKNVFFNKNCSLRLTSKQTYHGKSTFTMGNQHLRDPIIISSLLISSPLLSTSNSTFSTLNLFQSKSAKIAIFNKNCSLGLASKQTRRKRRFSTIISKSIKIM